MLEEIAISDESNQSPREVESHSLHYYYDLYSENQDTLYREPNDGIISVSRTDLRPFKNFGNNSLLSFWNSYNIHQIPEIELVTLIDISSLWKERQQQGILQAQVLSQYHHPNILNLTRPFQILDGVEPKTLLQFHTEAPGHIQ